MQIKQKAKGTMQGPNGSLVPGPGGNHFSAQNNQNLDYDPANQTGAQGNLGRGFDQGNLGQGFDNTATGGSVGSGYGSGAQTVQTLLCRICAVSAETRDLLMHNMC